MKKILIFAAIATAGMMSVSTTANAFATGKCKACHAIDKDKVGPAWATVAKDYGSADALAAVFKAGFNVGDRKVIANDSKWKGKAGIMTGQYKHLIKGHEDDAAKALFEAVKSGKM